jgi:cell division protein FtsB
MPPTVEITLQQTRRALNKGEAPPLRRQRLAAAAPSLELRKAVNFLLLFVTVVLVADSLIGDKGLMDTIRARQRFHELSDSVQRLSGENVRLLEIIRRLNQDPSAIEAIARQELGLVRTGEVLVILRDAQRQPR